MEKVRVTPELAALWLQSAKRQRTLRRSAVEGYAADMAVGRWREDIVPIAFDTDGNLSNGQHRLHAVLQSGVPVDFWVIRGVDRDSIMTMDMPLARRTADQLRLHDIADPALTSAIAKTVLRFERFPDRVWNTYACATVTKTLIQDEVLAAPEVFEGVARSARSAHRFAQSNQWGALSLLVQRYSTATHLWDQFAEGLIAGAGLAIDDPRLALRSYHARIRDMRPWGEGQSHLLAYIQAWNKFVDDEPLKLLKNPRREQLPMPKVR